MIIYGHDEVAPKHSVPGYPEVARSKAARSVAGSAESVLLSQGLS